MLSTMWNACRARTDVLRITAILLLALTCWAAGSPLDPFVGRDFWKDHASGQELADLKNILGDVPKGLLMPPDPWRVWKTDHAGQVRYIVLLGEDAATIPGGSSACIEIFDAARKKVGSSWFQTGWRNIFVAGELENDMVVISTAPVINGRNIAKEYFSIGGDRVRLVRIEDDKGALVQNEYVFPNSEIGPVPEANDVDAWAGLLESKDTADVLAALVFLGGRHITGPEQAFASEPHESQYAGLFQQLVAGARIQTDIQHLIESGNAWVKQAAVLAARPPRERPFQ